MAARGSVAKEQIINQILSNFDGAFKYDKEIRIPVEENGEIIQIKVTLTAAKTNVDMGGDTAIPGAKIVIKEAEGPQLTSGSGIDEFKTETNVFPTEEEKENVRTLMSSLGF